MRRKTFQKVSDGTLLVFEVSLLPIVPGKFEYTIRSRFSKRKNSQWIWAGQPNENVYLTVNQSPLYDVGLISPGAVREMLNWFETNYEYDETNQIRNYNSALLGALTLNQEDEVILLLMIARYQPGISGIIEQIKMVAESIKQ